MRQPHLKAVKMRLGDGTPTLFRPILRTDGPLLLEGFTRLSDRSRYQRFMGSVHELTPEMLARLTDVDHWHHAGWAAFDISGREAVGVAVGRYCTYEDAPTRADIALTVVDTHHGRGIGRVLMRLLGYTARRNDIRTFDCVTFNSNRAMKNLFLGIGGHVRLVEDGVVEMSAPVPHLPWSLTHDLGKVGDDVHVMRF